MPKPTLRDFYNKREPFGPIASPNIKDPEIMQSLFYKKNLIFEEMASHPSAIIGRRGAGKTAFLRSVHLDLRYKIKVELQAERAFREIINSIQEMSVGAVLVEEVSALWNMILWHTILVELGELSGTSEDLEIVKRYITGVGLKKTTKPYNAMKTMIEIFKERGGDRPIGMISQFIDETLFNGVTFTEAQKAALDFMEYEDMHAIVLIDALEDFRLDDETMCYAISGLLRCQGSFHMAGSPCALRCCLPAEIWHRLLNLSANPSKDFQHKILLHWHASELIRLAAHRYTNFLRLYQPESLQELAHLDLDKRSDAVTFWHSLLPESIENKIGGVEDPLAYLLRHTQLLPRHLLSYLNQISIKQQRNDTDLMKFERDAVLEGIHETEETICAQIFAAYKYVHASAQQACEQCIPYLPLRFTDGDLHRVYNRHGKTLQGIFDYQDFKKMMIEIGAIGRVTEVTSRYIEGLFEYIVPHKLITSSNDDLCLHPVFCEIHSAIKPKADEEPRAVYPYGSDIDEEEFRDLR